MAALSNLDSDMPQYIADNTDDELSHAAFINAYLVARGANPVSLERFRTLEGSRATGAAGKKRLTKPTPRLASSCTSLYAPSRRTARTSSRSCGSALAPSWFAAPWTTGSWRPSAGRQRLRVFYVRRDDRA
jgi:hypothetical protein